MDAKAKKNVSTEIQKAIIKRQKKVIDKEEKEQRKKTFQLRLSEVEMLQIKERMTEKNYKNMSDFIRTQCIAPHKINKKNFLQLAYEVNKIGNNLNQIARVANTEKKIDLAVISKIRDVDNLLTQLLKQSEF
jgi:Bacterial mobilisation protein (MobC)